MKQSLLSSWRDVNKTLAMTVGSPSAHRRGAMLKLISVLVLILTIGVGNVWGVDPSETVSISAIASANSWTNGNHYSGWTSSSGKFTFTAANTGQGLYYSSDNSWRGYNAKGAMVITAGSGITIKSVSSSPSKTWSVSGTGAGNSASFTPTATTKFTSFTITYTETSSCTTVPTVSVGSNSSVEATTATISCSGISSLGSAGCSISSYGFVIGSSANPSIDGSGVTKHEVGTSYTTVNTSFSKNLTGLSPTTTYYVRPYATNGKGTAYGTQTSFTTTALPKYTVTLKDDDSELTQASAGASINLPSRTGCTGYTFAGWTKSWTSAQTEWTTTAPTIIEAGSYTPQANENLYPVYTKTEGSGTTDVTVVPGTYTNKGSGNYGSGAERTGTVSTINFGAHYITGNQANSPVNPCSGGTYLQCQAANANIYNKTAMPGNITQVVVNQYAAQNIDLYCGTSQLMASDNTSTGQTPSGTVQTAQTAATQMTWNVSGNYKFFDLKKGSGTSYITSIVITYANSTTSYISEPNCCTSLGQINGSFFVSHGHCAFSVNTLGPIIVLPLSREHRIPPHLIYTTYIYREVKLPFSFSVS